MIKKVDPLPGPVEYADMVLSIASTSDRLIANPSPLESRRPDPFGPEIVCVEDGLKMLGTHPNTLIANLDRRDPVLVDCMHLDDS